MLRKEKILRSAALRRRIQRVVIQQHRAKMLRSASLLCGSGRSRVVSLAIGFALSSPKYLFGARLHLPPPSRADFQFNFCGSEPNACESARAKRRGQSHAPVEYFGKVEINDRITTDCSIARDAQCVVAKNRQLGPHHGQKRAPAAAEARSISPNSRKSASRFASLPFSPSASPSRSLRDAASAALRTRRK